MCSFHTDIERIEAENYDFSNSRLMTGQNGDEYACTDKIFSLAYFKAMSKNRRSLAMILEAEKLKKESRASIYFYLQLTFQDELKRKQNL